MIEQNGYSYVIQSRTRDDTQYLKCKLRNRHYCPGTAKIETDGQFVDICAHNHQPLVDVVAEFRQVLVERAKMEVTAIKVIYDQEAPRHFEASQTYPFSKAESTMRQARRRALPAIPGSLRELGELLQGDLQQRYRCCGNSTIYTATGDDGSESIIFCCSTLLGQATPGLEELHVDGTFKVVPNAPPSRQLLTIHGIIQNSSVVLGYVLMERQTRACYNAVFQKIKELVPTLSPRVIMTDYEAALQGAIRDNWPDTDLRGCYFHFAQAIWKKNARSYLPLINEREEGKRIVRMLMALALVPAPRMREAFELVRNQAEHLNVDIPRTFTYFERYWLGRVGAETFSVYGLPRRTNNNVKSFHNLLKTKFLPANHPNIWRFLDDVHGAIKTDHVKLGQLTAGVVPTRRQDKFLANDRRIKAARDCLELGEITLAEYLARVAYSNAQLEERLRNFRNAAQESEDEDGDDNIAPAVVLPAAPAAVLPAAPAAILPAAPAALLPAAPAAFLLAAPAAVLPAAPAAFLLAAPAAVLPAAPAAVLPAAPAAVLPAAPVAILPAIAPNDQDAAAATIAVAAAAAAAIFPAPPAAFLPAAPVAIPVVYDEVDFRIPEDEGVTEEEHAAMAQLWGRQNYNLRLEVNNPWEPPGQDTVAEEDDQRNSCPVCKINVMRFVYQCGHRTCGFFSIRCYNPNRLADSKCPVCRDPIYREPLMYFN